MMLKIRRWLLGRLYDRLERNCVSYIRKHHRKEEFSRWDNIKFKIWSRSEFRLRNFLYPPPPPAFFIKIKTPYDPRDLKVACNLISELEKRFPHSIIKLTDPNKPFFGDNH